ncbi:MAG: Universal stress protein UspA [Myxococcaceae bacterium]|nr:Universal stress protein UspA [Myxococcaceae bacterium]
MQTLRHFVSGTDFSDCAEQALQLAIELALATPTQITLVHVCELVGDGLDERRLSQCDLALRQLVARHACSQVEIRGLLRSGSAWTKLDNVAAEVGASLIVIGRHGAGRGRNVTLGSVADQVVRHASRPVLTAVCDFDCFDPETQACKRVGGEEKAS